MTDPKHLNHFPSIAELSYQLLAMICVNTQAQWTAMPSFLFTDMVLWRSTKPARLTDLLWEFHHSDGDRRTIYPKWIHLLRQPVKRTGLIGGRVQGGGSSFDWRTRSNYIPENVNGWFHIISVCPSL